MSGNTQSPILSSAWEAAFHLALADTHVPCTVVIDIVFVRRMLQPSLAAAHCLLATLPPSPPFPLVPLLLIALTSPSHPLC